MTSSNIASAAASVSTMLEATAVDIDDEDDPVDIIAQLRAARQSLAGQGKR